ncbi:MAG: hypothetical protein FJ276_34035 [Planctomycetes bacterium]|nr:hypothetical protein [Planctomycetota bacterium]
MSMTVSRRCFVQGAAATLLGGCCWGRMARAAVEDVRAPVRQITRGPKFHWFGYYDKLQFDPTDRYVLGMEVDFEHRSPRPDDVVTIGMVDLQDGDRWIELGRTTAWCWQQGCMLQWRPGSRTEVLWNDREQDRYVCRILDVETRALRTVPHPVYSVSPDGRWAVATDFRRVADTRPGYGYNGILDPYRDELMPGESGIWHVDLETGQAKLVISLADIASTPPLPGDLSKAKHWFNHLLVNPDGTRFEFLHRWKVPESRGLISGTRMFTAAPDGTAIRFLNSDTSHFNWRDPRHVIAWARHNPQGMGFFIFEDANGGLVEPLPKDAIPANGHVSYLPGLQWLLADSYPDAEDRQHVVLYNIPQSRRFNVGSFPLPREYNHKYIQEPSRECRCDLHPRFSRDGRGVVIDAPHSGGRQLHLIDVSAIVG